MIHADPEKLNTRDILILLDQSGNDENIGKPGRFFLTNKLQSAINEQAMPIIINASLWSAFIEKRMSIAQMSQIPDSSEKKGFDLYTKIGERLNYWANHYKEKNIDPMQAKELMLEKVNDEFYTKESKPTDEKIETVPGDISAALSSYLTTFNKDDWEAYTNNKSFYLLVPKKYVNELEQKEKSQPKQKNLTQKELLLGLKVDHLVKINDLEDPSLCYFDALNMNNHLPQHLSDFFVTNKEWDSKAMPYAWNIILSGHGGHKYREITTEKVTPNVTAIIADLTPEEFHSLLQYWEKNIAVNCFHYSTCSGAGNHIKMAFDDYGNQAYHYTIICGCLSDGYTHCLWKHLPFPTNDKTPLAATDIACEEDGKWRISIDHKYQWKKFLESLSKNSLKKQNLDWLITALPLITYTTLCDNPMVRLAHTTAFVPVLPNKITTINNALIKIKQQEEAKNINIWQDIILVDTPHIPLPVIIKNPARIVSIAPGKSSHYFDKLEFKNATNFFDTFCPIEGNSYFDKFFLIGEIIVPNDKKSPIAQKLGADGEKITAKNILVHVQQDTLMRVFAQIENNYFMITINRMDYINGRANLKGITKMSPEVVQTYLKHYNQLKEGLVR